MSGERAVRVLRVIARLNVGGPAIQAITLTRALENRGYTTTLVRGAEGPREGSMDALAERIGVVPVRIPSLRRALGPGDVRTIWTIRKLLATFRPEVLHTHAAKAGTTARLASLLLAPSRRPAVRVHTFHGHVLTGYFSPLSALFFRTIERALALTTTRLIAVSEEVADDLVRLRIAPRPKIEVIPLGFDLSVFKLDDAHRASLREAMRAEFGIAPEEKVVTLVARLVPIKCVDRFLRVAERVARRAPEARFLIVGDGELADDLETAAAPLGERVVWTGLRHDMPAIYAASDVVALTSDNEGTPVSLIEASAAGLPVVSTAVGGVASVVRHGVTGFVVPREAEDAMAGFIEDLLSNGEQAAAMGAAGAEHVNGRFSLERLVVDIDRLYRTLLADGR